MEIEKAGHDALELFKFDRNQIEALRVAIGAAENLQKWTLNNPSVATYPSTSPLLALQVILSKIRERHQFVGHRSTVRSVCFSPNQDAIATASCDNTVKLWDLQGNCLVTFTGHNDWVTSVCFNPTQDMIATASCDNTVKLWDLQGNCLVTFTGHQKSVNSVSFTPRRKAIATGSSDNTAKLWDLQGNCLVTFTGHNDSVNSVSFSPTQDAIATASDDGTAKLWDLQGNLLADYNGYKGNFLKGEADFVELKTPIYSVCFSRDGKFLITGSEDGKVRFWPIESLDELLARAREWLGEKI
jgi:WD40 repeat protein